MSEVMQVRQAGPTDAPLIAGHRVAMFREMARLSEQDAPSFQGAARTALEAALIAGSYRGWLVVLPDGEAVGGAGVLLRPLLPRPDLPPGPEAIVLNVYVEPAYRRQGLARTLMETILAWCQAEKIGRIVLHPSPVGQPLYVALGFVPTGELIYRGE